MEIAHEILTDLKNRRSQLVAEAMKSPIEGLTVLEFEHGPYGVQAYYEKETDEFVEVNFYLKGVPDDEIKIGHAIHPPKGKAW